MSDTATTRPVRLASLVLTLLLVASLIAISGPVHAAGSTAISLEPEQQRLTPGETTTIDVVVTDATGGIGALTTTVSLADPTVADIVNVTVRGDPGVQEVTTNTSDATATAALMDTPDTGRVTVLTVTVEAVTPGTTDVAATVSALGDENGNAYTVTGVRGGELTVEANDSDDGEDADGPSTTVRVTPTDATVSTGATTTFAVRVTNASDGVGAIEFTVSTGDSAVAPITNVTLRGSPGLQNVTRASDGSRAQVRAALMNTTDAGSVTVATVTVRGGAAGTAQLGLAVTALGTETGTAYTVTQIDDATVTVDGEPEPPQDEFGLELEPSRQGVAPGGSITYDVVVNDAADGVGAYDLDLSIGNTSTATIAGVTNEIGGTSRTEFAADNSSVRIGTFAGNTGDDGSGIVIATVTVTGERLGGTTLTLDPTSVSDEDGDQYTVAGSVDATVTVAENPVTLTVQPSAPVVATGGTRTIELVADGMDRGVGAYGVTVNASNPSVAIITEATTTIGGTGRTPVATDGSGVRLGAFNGDTNDTGPVAIGTVTVEGVARGTVDLSLRVESISDENGTQYPVGRTTDAALTVRTAPDVTGDGNPATDPDDDGRYEDVNGDGEATAGDATVLFNAVFDENSAVTDNVSLFDFNTDGDVTPGDATVLFNEVF